jgi:hypothetical protein
VKAVEVAKKTAVRCWEAVRSELVMQGSKRLRICTRSVHFLQHAVVSETCAPLLNIDVRPLPAQLPRQMLLSMSAATSVCTVVQQRMHSTVLTVTIWDPAERTHHRHGLCPQNRGSVIGFVLACRLSLQAL